MRCNLSVAVILAALGALAAAAQGQSVPAAPQGQSIPAAPSKPPGTPPPLPTGPAPDLDLVFTAQVVGWVEPCG